MGASESVPLLAVGKVQSLTYRESKVVEFVLNGKTEGEALRLAGFGICYSGHPNRFPAIDKIRAEVARLQERVSTEVLELGLVNAVELHEQASDELRGSLSELYNPRDPLDPRFNPSFTAGDLLPIDLWPMWAQQGGVEVLDEPNMVHSDDDGGGSWDQKGRRIKVRMVPGHRLKVREFAAKLKTVNALVEAKSGDVNINIVHAQITQKLQGALARQAKLIEGKAEEGK